MDGASAVSTFIYITLPHLARPITVVILIDTIFLLMVFAEIYVTTGGGPGLSTTNIALLIYSQALIQFEEPWAILIPLYDTPGWSDGP